MNTYAKKVKKSNKLLNKTAVREFIFSKFPECHTVIGLAGPNINEYLDWCDSRGLRNAIIYENSKETFFKQTEIIRRPAKIILGSINEADPNKKYTFYDLDYCSTIIKVREFIPKFQKNYAITLALRKVGYKSTLKQFFKCMQATVLAYKDQTWPVKHTIYNTDKGEFIYAPYFDTSAMCCITKLN